MIDNPGCYGLLSFSHSRYQTQSDSPIGHCLMQKPLLAVNNVVSFQQ